MKISKNPPETLFGIWLAHSRVDYGYTCADIAEKLHCTRQTIRSHEMGSVKPSYVFCLGYGKVFNCDPEDIWKIVNSD